MVENGFKDIDGDDSADEEGGGFDVERVRELWGFVLRATRRRIKLALATFVIVAALGLTIASTMPRTYTAEVKLLTQRTSAIRVLSHSDPGMESVDNPTKNVAQMIMRRENLVALVKDAHLAERFQATRPAALRLKDRIMAKIFGPPSADDMEKAMTATLESKLDVKVGDDGIVDITVDWSNPLIAFDLATLVQTNFLEARYDGDVAAINESITILDDHAKNELAVVDAQLEAYQNVVETRIVPAVLAAEAAANSRMPGAVGPRPSGGRGVGPSLPAAIVDPEVTKALEEKRLQIKSLEDSRQRTIDDLRQQLNQAQLTLTPMHPTVITLQQRVDASSQPSPELAQLRAEEHALMAQIAPPRPIAAAAPVPAARPTPAPADKDAPPEPTATATAPALAIPTTLAQQAPDGPLQLAQSKLEASIRSYQDAVSRSDAARVELDIARAAYKHRYTVFTPAELPKKPKKATAQLVGVGSVFASVLLALLLAAAADMGTGIVIEPWQVRRRLKLDVLGELDNPS